MQLGLRRIGLVLVCLALTACSLPRGAALQSEITEASKEQDSSFQVVPVSRANVTDVMRWPATGWHGHYHWLDTHAAPSSQLIRRGDRVSVTVWDSQDNSLLTSVGQKSVQMEAMTVSEDGSIFLPYIGKVAVAGLTSAGARERVQGQLEPIAPSAQVQLSVDQGQSNSVDLVSGVPRPGTYPLISRDYTILSLLSAGGGVSSNLRNPIVRLIRNGNTYEITADQLLSTARKDTVLRGNDKVVVEEDQRAFTALGASGIESLIYFPKDELTALEATALMGGLSDDRADPKGVLVLREYAADGLRQDTSGPNRQQVVFVMDLTSADGLFAARNFMIHPQDTVLATESPVANARTVFGLIGAVLGLSAQAQRL